MKQQLEGEAAFQAIRQLLNGANSGQDFCCPSDPPLERLRTALIDSTCAASRLGARRPHSTGS